MPVAPTIPTRNLLLLIFTFLLSLYFFSLDVVRQSVRTLHVITLLTFYPVFLLLIIHLLVIFSAYYFFFLFQIRFTLMYYMLSSAILFVSHSIYFNVLNVIIQQDWWMIEFSSSNLLYCGLA